LEGRVILTTKIKEMKTLKIILLQTIDLIFLVITAGLLAWYFINPDKNFTGFLLIISGYIVYNIYNKAIIAKQYSEGCEEN